LNNGNSVGVPFSESSFFKFCQPIDLTQNTIEIDLNGAVDGYVAKSYDFKYQSNCSGSSYASIISRLTTSCQ